MAQVGSVVFSPARSALGHDSELLEIVAPSPRLGHFIGVDPGMGGGIACVRSDGALEWCVPMPVIGKAIDVRALASLIAGGEGSTVGVEACHSMPAQGVASSFRFGKNCGIVEGVVGTLGLPLVMVTPQAWQKVMHAGIERSLDPKQRSLLVATRLFPQQRFLPTSRSTKPHDGLVDASLIARYLRDVTARKGQ